MLIGQRKISFRLKLHLLALCLCCCYTLLGQSGEFSVNHKLFTQADGLSSNVTFTAVEDKNGIIWIGTQKGVTRFDGTNLKAFNRNNGIALDEVQELFIDKDVLWCFQEIGEKYLVYLFHTKEEKLISIKEYLGKALPFEQSDITSIQLLHNGIIFHLKGQKTFSYIPKRGFTELKMPPTHTQILSISEDNNYWLVNTEKQIQLNKVNSSGEVLLRTSSAFFEDNILNKIIEIGEEFIDENNQLFIKFLTDYQFGFFSLSPAGKYKLEGRRLRSSFDPNILTLDFKNLKFHQNEGLLSYRLNNDISFYLRDGKRLNMFTIPVKNGLGKCLISDHFLLFLTKDGICLADFTINLKPSPFKTFLKEEEIATRGIMAVDEQLFINAINLYIGKTDLQPNVQILDEDSEGFGIIKDKKNNVWIQRRGRLLYLDTKTQNIKTYPINESPWALHEDANGLIWHKSSEGISRLNPQTGEISSLPKSGLEEFTDLQIYHFLRKADGLLFLATNKGLFEFSLQKGVIGRYSSKLQDKYYLPANDFRHVYYDKETSYYWLASSEGLIRWNPEKAEYKTFKFNNLAANVIAALYPDNYGHLWISTENGIIQFDKSNYKFKTYLEKDGISHHEFNRMSHFQDTDGTIYFGGMAGITKFHPRDFTRALNEVKNPKISILELNQYLGRTNNIENVTPQFHQKKGIIVEPDDGYFTLKVGLTDYPIFSQVQLLYKLKGTTNWEKAVDKDITVRKLAYGNYTLQIKAIGESGQFNEKYLEIPIFIKKPLYLQWWFWLLILLALTTAMAFFVQWRTKKIKKRNFELEQEVAKRTAQIEQDKKIIEQQAERLLELDKTKSKFFANVSHELRTPITLIKGPIQSVLKSKNLDKQTFNLLTTAERNTASLLGLVNEILDLTKLEASKLTLDEKATNLYAFLSRIVFNFQSIADVQNIAYYFDYQIEKTLQIQLDEAKLEKVLNNLLSNAFKFTPENGRIDVKVTENSSVILLAVKDSGRGISAEDIPNVFNRFYQSKNNSKAEGGLGIGLSLSMEFVKLMHGKLWVESSTEGNDKGSAFYVEIPKKEVAVPAIDSQSVVLSNTVITDENIPSTHHKHTILLVEDNADLREYVSFLLAPFYTIIPARNGQEALEKLAKNNCQLILSDVMMPIMDGFEFLDAVKSNAVYRNIPFIMLTARAELKDRLKALRIGVDDYMLKPFDETELLVRIKNLLTNFENRLNYFSKSQGSKEAELLSIPEHDKLWLQNLEMLVLRDINSSIFSVDYLVQILDTNRNTFYSKVKTLTGLSPNKYVQVIRLQKAKDLLENSTLSVKEITEKVGFKTPDYFTRLFKNEYGKLPSDYLR